MPIRINESMPVFQKLKQEQVFVMPESRAASQDIRELERILWQELGSKEDYDNYVGNSLFGGNVAAFIRRTMNFDYDVALKKFHEFLQVLIMTMTGCVKEMFGNYILRQFRKQVYTILSAS